MDVEKAIQALIEGDIRAQKRADLADQRADERAQRDAERAQRAAERADRADKRMDKLDKQIQAMANVVRVGIKLVREERKKSAEEWKKQKEENKELNFKINALIESQDRADEQCAYAEERLADHLRRRPQFGADGAGEFAAARSDRHNPGWLIESHREGEGGRKLQLVRCQRR